MIVLWKLLKKLWVNAIFVLVVWCILCKESIVLASSFAENSTFDSFLSAGFALFIVILIIVCTFKLVKYLNKSISKSIKTKNIEVIESFPLSPTTRIHLMKIKNLVYVIAENAHTIEIITTLDSSEISFEHKNTSLFNDILKSKWNKAVQSKKSDSEENH